MGFVSKFGMTIVVAVAAALVGMQVQKRIDLPDHLLHHKALFVPNLLTPEVGEQLLNLIKEMKDFPTNSNDLQFYTTKHEHIGEATPVGADGKCEHPFLIPNTNRTQCILPGRVDVGRHFIMTGGVQGLKENYDDMISRLLSFGRYMFDLSKYPIVQQLFKDKIFVDAAKTVCPAHKPVLDPFQFNFIMQVPGQSVALHLDAPYMWGATRFQFPQWLLVAMVYSGLFNDRFVDQVQVVGYVHKWDDPSRDGEFVYWDENNPVPKRVPPTGLAGSAVDGSKVAHAASVYQRSVKAPRIDKSAENILSYKGDDKWELTSAGKLVKKYTTDDLRITIVYRARCFESEERRERFKNLPDEEYLQLDDILETFRKDLVEKGKFAADSKPDPLTLGLAILDNYIKYPLPAETLIPYNYCALGRLVPAANHLLKHIC